MGWYELYKNNHYSGGMDFDYFPAVICNDKFLAKALGELVDLYLRSEHNVCLKSFSRRLIEGVLIYFSEHKWSREINKVLLFSNGFLSSCLKLDPIFKNEQIIHLARDLKEYSLSGALIQDNSDIDVSCHQIIDLLITKHDNDIFNNRKLLEELLLSLRGCVQDKTIRDKLDNEKLFLIRCINMRDTLENQEIRKSAKYLLINFVEGYITEDIILEVKTLVLEK